MPVDVNLPTPGPGDVWGAALNLEIEKIAALAGTSTVAGLEGDIEPEDLADAISPFVTGVRGLSAYEVWLAQGNTGSVDDYLAAIKGASGAPGDTLTIGTVTTVAPGGAASATISGTSPNKVLNLGIPRGADGSDGAKGDKGDPGAGVPSGGQARQILRKVSATNYDTEWTNAAVIFRVASDTERNALLSTVGSSALYPLWVEHTGGAKVGMVERHRGSSWEPMLPPVAWQTYTPSVDNITLGNGTIVGAFTQIGRTVHYRAMLTCGSTTTFNSLAILGIPRQIVSSSQLLGYGFVSKANGTGAQMVMARPWTGTSAGIYLAKDGAAVAAGSPFAWQEGDLLTYSGTYEGAIP